MDKIQEQQIIEGNKLIAEFMGTPHAEFKSDKSELNGAIFYCEKDNSFWDYDPVLWLSYNTDWGILMPVVEKIEVEQGCIIEMWLSLGKGCRINRLQPKGSNPITIPFIAESNSLIECVYSAVIQFITWYTTTQTKNK